VRLRRLSLKDQELFSRYLNLKSQELSVFAFQNIYIWKGLFDITWAIIAGSLCIFFKDKTGAFLYLSPQGKEISWGLVEEIFKILDGLNKNKEASRIENVEAGQVPFYRNLGYDSVIKSYDYLCLRSDLVNLQGDRFKSKRASANYFTRHYDFEFLPFASQYKAECLRLYDRWMSQRKSRTNDRIYLGMMEDSRASLKIALANYRALDFIGRVVKVNREIKAFTFGYRLNPDTFCVLYEIAELSIKGLAQFIFRSFASELKGVKFVNIMDDSGLKNLQEVKMSYRPVRLIPAYIVQRKR